MVCVVFPKIENSGTIGTSLDACPATDASVVVNRDCAILNFICGIYGANRNAGRNITLHTRARKEITGHLRVSPHFFLENRAVHHPWR